MKSEPDVYSISDLQRERKTFWEGVRNYQARNFMLQEMQIGDPVLFYHSNANPSGVAGRARVCQRALPDPSQFDPKSTYFDAKAHPEKPLWFGVQIEFVEAFPRVLSLEELRKEKKLTGVPLLARGQRLSVQPVTEAQFQIILELLKRG